MRKKISDQAGIRSQDFFGKVSSGGQDYAPNANYAGFQTALLDSLPENVAATGARYFEEMSHFGRHIGASVPFYDQLQIGTAHALVQTFSEGARGLIIGGSDGRFGRTVSGVSGEI